MRGFAQYECKTCQKDFVRAGNVLSHMVAIHGYKPSIYKDHRCRPRILDPTNNLLREASNFAKYSVINGG